MLGLSDYDSALREDKPAALGPNASNEDLRTYNSNLEKWEKSNKMALMVLKATISNAIKEAIPDKKENGEELTGKEFFASIEKNFKSSSKTYASTLIMKMCTSRYDGKGGIREHIMSMCDMAAKLKVLDMAISEGFLVHFIMTSLPDHYTPFKVSYNTQKGKWSISELISYCVEEEERQKSKKKDTTNLVALGKGKNQAESSGSRQPRKKFKPNKKNENYNNNKNFGKNNGKNNGNNNHAQDNGPRTCKFCGSPKHFQKYCPGFKEWCGKNGKDSVSFVDESFLANYSPDTWWIDSGATVHISNSLQVFSTMRTIRRGEQTLRVADGHEVEVKGIGSFSLDLASGFSL